MQVGDKIKMCSERNRYTIQAFDDRFILATAPFFDTYFWCLIDKVEQVRGPMNTLFGLPCSDVNTPEGAAETLQWMREKLGGYETWGVSERNRLDLTYKERVQLELERYDDVPACLYVRFVNGVPEFCNEGDVGSERFLSEETTADMVYNQTMTYALHKEMTQ